MELDRNKRVVVTGAGGFIGGHLVAELLRRGFEASAPWTSSPSVAGTSSTKGSRTSPPTSATLTPCREAAADRASFVFNLAADMGGMGFIETHKADCMVSVLINTHMLIASRDAGVEQFLFGSSACVYAADKQTDPGHGAKRVMPTRRCRRMAMAGRNYKSY